MKQLNGLPIVALFALMTIDVHSQNIVSKATTDETATARKVDMLNNVPGQGYDVLGFDHRYDGVKGTPYLNKGWQKAELKLDHNQIVHDVVLKYDILGKNLLAKQKGDSIILGTDRIQEFVLHELSSTSGIEHERVFRRYKDAPTVKLSQEYFEVLVDGKKTTLLKLHEKELKKVNMQAAYGPNERNDVIVDRSAYYVRHADGKMLPITFTRKGLLAAFAGQESTLESAINQYGSPVRSESDATAVMLLLNK